jgi:Secretion system C-terminal sorting domain/Pregnancy-associated plasma protein-A
VGVNYQIFVTMKKRNSNIIKALKTRWFCFAVLLSFNIGVTTLPCELNAQSGCFTNGGPGCVGYLPILNQPNNNNYTVRVHFIALRRGDGSGGISEDLAQQSLDVLNDNFNPHNIFFDWDCELHELRNDDFYDEPGLNRCAIYSNIFVPNGMNIFIGGDEVVNAGIASGIPGVSMIVSGSKYYNGVRIIGSRGISIVHEMGHCLGLWHTHHGTEEITSGTNCGAPWSSGSCAECVDGSLSLTCGDFVVDTPADPNDWFEGCGYYGVAEDVCNQEAFNPIIDNVMNNASNNCRHFFTAGQATRMRNILEYHSFPTNIIIGNRIINVTKSISGVPCQNSSLSISYEFCLDGTNIPTNVDLNATVTPSNQVTLSGDFPPTGIIQNLSITPACTTLVLVVNIGNIPVGDMFTVSLSILNNNNGDGRFGIDDCELEDVFSVNAPNAEFTYDTDNCTYLFESNDDLGTHTWNFGDNSPFSNSINPAHEFENGTYQVTHTVDYGCGIDVELQTIVVDCFEDFECYCGPSGIHLGVENEPRFISEYNIVGAIASKCVAIAGHLILNEDLTIINSTIKMQPGSSIEIQPGITFRIFGSSVSGCNEMWDGIVVNNTASIFFALTSIEDADIAITALNGANLMVNTTQFNRNRIGISAQSSFNLNPFYGNTFDCTTPLSEPLAGQISEAGVVVADGNLVTIGVQGELANTFKNMNNGIIAFNNSLTVVNSNFDNIKSFGGGNLPIAGYGIHADGGSLGMLKNFVQKGNGLAARSFNNCTYGIHCRRMSANITRNSMYNVSDGIYVGNAGQSVFIQLNYVNRCRLGIGVAMSDPAASRFIDRNKITVEGEGTGISITESTVPSKLTLPGVVQYNTVYLADNTEDMTGILLGTVSKMQAKGNTVETKGTTSLGGRIGISMSGGLANSVEENNVTGLSVSNGAIGIAGWGASQMLWSKNIVEKMSEGFRFISACQSNNGFRCNYMEQHNIGLHFNTGAKLGTQRGMGNQWKSGTFIDKGLRHEDGAGAISSTLFHANPAIPDHWPTAIPTTILVPTTTTIACSPPVLDTIAFDGGDETDKKIAENTSTEFNTVRYLSERYLYRKLTQKPNLMASEPILASFYNAMGTTPIGKLFNMEEAIGNLMRLDNNTAQSLETNYAQFVSKHTALLETDSMLVNATGQDSLSLVNNRNTLLQQLFSLEQSNASIWSNIKAQRTAGTVNLLTTNNDIGTSYVFETNDKLVNGVYLNWVASGQPDLTTAQISTLGNIANQCPSTGGNAVFRARSVLSMLSFQYYGNDLNCTGQYTSMPQNKVQVDKASDKVLLYPNPAKEAVNLSWEAMEGEGMLTLSDLMGNQFMVKTLDMTVGSADFDTKELPPAMYICRIVQGGEVLLSEKLVIIK